LKKTGRLLIAQWVVLTVIFVVVFYRVVYDLTTGRHDNLFALWAIIAVLMFISSTLTGVAMWRSRSVSR
jgi:hypothetical protein